MPEEKFSGLAILIAEDEYYVATELARELARAGATVIGPAPSVDKALDLNGSHARIDAALLDVNLGGEIVFSVADLLRERHVPFLFATGYDRSMIPPRFDDVVRCEKPVGADKLGAALANVLSGK
ncbi:response regulator [Altererythrobacter aurantiacus]|uniref:Response regulator n=1 Tax=Parapontixanthobacter aurantiacus TaxID=1463599 RepID=A0A844ZBZ2_9SPHN|nr:response regulator [Parapontixanthobacter aurantiacus]MXO84430.1 response regulator [Parapontixanthobacter aurantiacus]